MWTIVFVFTMVKLINLLWVFFQLPPIVNWKVILVIFQKKRHFFVIFFSFSICGRSKKNPFFSTFFEKREKILKSYSKNSCIFDITYGESWHFFCTQNEVQSSYRNWDRKFGLFQIFFWKTCLQSMEVIFFFVFQNKKFKLSTRIGGGGSKSPFLKTRLWDY